MLDLGHIPPRVCAQCGHANLPLAGTCAACHAANDVHGGHFGTQCERCHTPVSFRDIKAFGFRNAVPPSSAPVAAPGVRP